MAFAAQLRRSLRRRESEVPIELERGESLKEVLDRHLLTVETMAVEELIASVFLLSPDGKQLSFGAGPNVPAAYREAVKDAKIGPRAGCCGPAVCFGRPVYARDIATDPLWDEFRQFALSNGLRSCWSTPIRGPDNSILGTFVIYHHTPAGPTEEEIEAIDMITTHVAAAIARARASQDLGPPPANGTQKPQLRIVPDPGDAAPLREGFERLLRSIEALELRAAQMDRCADAATNGDSAAALRSAAEECRRLVSAVRLEIARRPSRPDK